MFYHIRHTDTDDKAKPVACSLVGSWLHCVNATLNGISSSSLKKLQMVQKPLYIFVLLLQQIHYITCMSFTGCLEKSVTWCIKFRIACLTIDKAQNTSLKSYLHTVLTPFFLNLLTVIVESHVLSWCPLQSSYFELSTTKGRLANSLS